MQPLHPPAASLAEEERIGIAEQTQAQWTTDDGEEEDADAELSSTSDGSSPACSERCCRSMCLAAQRRCSFLQPALSSQLCWLLMLCVALLSTFLLVSLSAGARFPSLALRAHEPEPSAREAAEWPPLQQTESGESAVALNPSDPPLPCLSCSLCPDNPVSPELSWYESGDYSTFSVLVAGSTVRTPEVTEWPSIEDVSKRFRLRRWTDASLRTTSSRNDSSSEAASESRRLADLGMPRIEWSWANIEIWQKSTRVLRGVVVFPDRPTADAACIARARNITAHATCAAPTDNVEERFKRDCCLNSDSASAAISSGSVSSCSLPFPSSFHGFYTLEAVGLTAASAPIQWYRAPWANNAPADPRRWPPADTPQWDQSVRLPPENEAVLWPLPSSVRLQCLASIVISADHRTCPTEFDWAVREDLGALVISGSDVRGQRKTQGLDVIGVRFVQQASSAAMKATPESVLSDSVAAGPNAAAAARLAASADLTAQNSVPATSFRRDSDVVFASEALTYAPIVVDLLNGSYIVPLPTATKQQRAQLFEMRRVHAIGPLCDDDKPHALECAHAMMPDDTWRSSMARSPELVKASFMEKKMAGEQKARYRADIIIYDLYQVCPRCSAVFRPFSWLTTDSRLLIQKLTLPVRAAIDHNDGDQIATSLFMATGAMPATKPDAKPQQPAQRDLVIVGTSLPQRPALPDADAASMPPLALSIDSATSKLAPAGSAASVCRFTWQQISAEGSATAAAVSPQQRQSLYGRMSHPMAPVFTQGTVLSAPLRFYSGPAVRAVPVDAWATSSANVTAAMLSSLAPIGAQLMRTYSWPGPSVSGDVTWRAVPAGSACPAGVCVDSDPSDLLVTRPPTQWLFTPDNCVLIRYHKESLRRCMSKHGISKIGIIGDSLSMNWANDVLTPFMKDIVQVGTIWEFAWKQDAAPISRGLSNYLHSWGMTDGKWNEVVDMFNTAQLVVINSGVHYLTVEFNWQLDWYGLKLRLLEAYEGDLTEFLTQLSVTQRSKLIWRVSTFSSLVSNNHIDGARFANLLENPQKQIMAEQFNAVTLRVLSLFGIPHLYAGHLYRGHNHFFRDVVHPHTPIEEMFSQLLMNQICNEQFMQTLT